MQILYKTNARFHFIKQQYYNMYIAKRALIIITFN